jgi:3-oxoacyl-[acyl-carrier protein] reductase
MDLGIAGKPVLVTGGSRGMGFEAAKMLAAEGCQVAIVARGKVAVDEAVAGITSAGGTALGIAADMTDRDDVRRAVATVREVYGSPLIAIGQAKHIVPGDFADIDEAGHYLDAFRAYTLSQLYLLKEVLPDMQAAGWGRYVHIGSATAKEPVGLIHHSIANAARPSTIGLLKTVADEYAKFGITVNTVAPGWILTDNVREYTSTYLGLATDDVRDTWAKETFQVPAGRMGRPEEIASLIVYLCSDLAGYLTGKWIEVDGGVHRSAF